VIVRPLKAFGVAAPIKLERAARLGVSTRQVATNIPGWTRVTDMLADPIAPDTVITAPGIKVVGSGSALVAGGIAYDYEYATHQARIVRGASEVLVTGPSQTYPNAPVGLTVGVPSTEVQLVDGDVLYLEFYVDSNFATTDEITAGWPTWFSVTPVGREPRVMVKVAAQAITAANVYQQLLQFAADPYVVGSVMDTANNGLRASKSGQFQVHAYGRMTGANTTGNKVRVYVNGNPVGVEYTNAAGATLQFGGVQTLTLANNDLVTIWGSSNGTINSRRTFTGDGSRDQTWLGLVPV
jgi:hypothetical protein